MGEQKPQMRALGAGELILRKEQLNTDYNSQLFHAMGIYYDLHQTIVPDNYSYGNVQSVDGVYFIRRFIGGNMYLMAANATTGTKKISTSSKKLWFEQEIEVGGKKSKSWTTNLPCARLNNKDKATSDTLNPQEIQLIRVFKPWSDPKVLLLLLDGSVEDVFHASVSDITVFSGHSPPIEKGSIYSPVKIDRLAERVTELARLLNSHNLPLRAD